MSTPGGALAPYSQGNDVVTPSAISSPKSSAVFHLGEVLKTIVHNSRSFVSEQHVDDAVNIIDDFVRAFVPSAEMAAVVLSDVRAAKEDVTLRTPPGGGMAAQVVSGPVLDYAKLAQAILAEQRKMQVEG